MLFTIFFLVLSSFTTPTPAGPDSEEISQAIDHAYRELNDVRQNPAKYAQVYSLRALNRLEPRQPLVRDTMLERLALQKAQDMANRNYFGHVDKSGKGMNYYLWEAGYPLPDYYSKKSRDNNVESICAQNTGLMGFIRELIIDKGVPGYGHRVHLLGLDDFNAKHTHVGIGIAYNARSTYKYYCSILVVHRAEQMEEN